MPTKPTKPAPKKTVAKAKPGPKPDVLKIEGDWEAAVAKSFTKKKPAGGWPDTPNATDRAVIDDAVVGQAKKAARTLTPKTQPSTKKG